MRTRTSPKRRVRQRASPVRPACVVTSTWLQSTVPNGRLSIFISMTTREYVGEQGRVDIAAGDRERDALAGERLALTPGGGKRGGAGALGHVVSHREDAPHGVGEL